MFFKFLIFFYFEFSNFFHFFYNLEEAMQCVMIPANSGFNDAPPTCKFN